LTLRDGRPTHVAIADQTMMELQRHREVAYSKSNTDSADGSSAQRTIINSSPSDDDAPIDVEVLRRTMDRYRKAGAVARLLKRLQKAGHLIHVAAPHAAKVRYFGGSRTAGEISSGEEDGGERTWAKTDIIGSNALRDRLILEAAFQQ